MAVIDFGDLLPGTWGPKVDPQDGTYTYQIRRSVVTDTLMTGLQVISTNGFPRKWQTPHPADPYALCIAVDAQQDEEDQYHWILTYSYSTKLPLLAQADPNGGGGQPNPNTNPDDPLSQWPELSYGCKMFKKLLDRDLDDKLFRNSSWEPYPPQEVEDPRLLVRVTRNLRTFDVGLLKTWPGAVNRVIYYGQDPRFVRCEDLKAQTKRNHNTFYWVVTAEFCLANSSEDWLVKKLDAGFLKWEDPTGGAMPDFEEAVPIFVRGQRPARPVPLDGSGQVLAAGGALVYNQFRVCREVDFNAINLFT